MSCCVIMRSHDDMPLIADTLRMLGEQDHPYELIVFDNASTDGTLQEVEKHTSNIHHVPAGAYVPGKVLNRAMEATRGELVIFLNSDCTPRDGLWLSKLLAGFEGEDVAAVFSRQVARKEHHILHRKDTEDTFGSGERQRHWRHCFSMASSGIRRSLWEGMRFSEELQYSEDIDWTWRVRQRGHRIRYVPDSVVTHSHNYSLRQFYRRHYGEGRAESRIFPWAPWERSFLRYSLLPYGRQVLSDGWYCMKRLAIGAAFYSPILRMAQMMGRWAGFLKGLRDGVGEG